MYFLCFDDANLTVNSRDAQRDGIWAWDCEHKEPILIFPTVLALLGDNPMHSEFACHIGLRGKFFCRSCWVKGSYVEDAGNILRNVSRGASRDNSPAPSSAGSNANSDTANDPAAATTSNTLPGSGMESRPATSGKRKKYEESYSVMFDRVSAFVKVCGKFTSGLPSHLFA